eukprot:g11681.t1
MWTLAAVTQSEVTTTVASHTNTLVSVICSPASSRQNTKDFLLVGTNSFPNPHVSMLMEKRFLKKKEKRVKQVYNCGLVIWKNENIDCMRRQTKRGRYGVCIGRR